MSESVLVDAATVAAGASCAVVTFAVPAGAGAVSFRVACDWAHTCKFYAADATFAAIANAALIPEETRPHVQATTGTSGYLHTVEPAGRSHVACVVTNDGSGPATVTVAAA